MRPASLPPSIGSKVLLLPRLSPCLLCHLHSTCLPSRWRHPRPTRSMQTLQVVLGWLSLWARLGLSTTSSAGPREVSTSRRCSAWEAAPHVCSWVWTALTSGAFGGSRSQAWWCTRTRLATAAAMRSLASEARTFTVTGWRGQGAPRPSTFQAMLARAKSPRPTPSRASARGLGLGRCTATWAPPRSSTSWWRRRPWAEARP
mmetsp:Transcript_11199/g.31512  ORF Transcript_11199/g.31512 Transcript_11199/m.31512 type:complete len:202 (-) Transcript_11199:1255-1860(-)